MSDVPTKASWPPLITDATRPPWVLRRDRILTVFVWILFLVLFIEQWLVFQARIETYLATPGAEWDFLMGPFFAVVGVMVIWLVFSAAFTYRRVIRARRRSPPPPLPLEAEAAHLGVTPSKLLAARELQMIAVAIEPGGRFRFETPPTYTAAAAGTNPPAPVPPGR